MDKFDNILYVLVYAVLIYLIVAIVVGIIITAIKLLIDCRIFYKMGIEWWKAIIPIYNEYIIFDHVWDVRYFILLYAGIVVSFVLSTMAGVIESYNSVMYVILLLLSCMVSIVPLIIRIFKTYRLLECFGHGVGFTIAFLFFPLICGLILAFNSDEYTPLYEKSNYAEISHYIE